MDTKAISTGFGRTAAFVAVIMLVLAGGVAMPAPKTAYATECVLTVDRSTITKGETATISWSKHNADERLTIDNGVGRVGDGKTAGTVKVSPAVTTTYTGTNTNAAGTKSMKCSVTVRVVEPPKPPYCQIEASKTTIFKGQSSTITWTSKNTNGGTFNPGNTSIQPNGSVDVSPQVTTTYVTKFTGEGYKTVECSVKVEVGELPPPPPPPVSDLKCTMDASSRNLTKGQSTTISWTSKDAVSAVLNPGNTSIDVNGSVSVSPEVSTTYKGTFTDIEGKTIDCEVPITVTEPTPEPQLRCEMNISPSTVSKDAEATLSWSSDNATAASIDNSIGGVDVDGSRSVTVTGDTTYTGTFTDANNHTVNCSATVRIESNGGTGGTGGTTGGGSGRCLNCGDDDDDHHSKKKVNPSIVLSKTFESAPERYVTLTEVPYTGFEAGPVLTAMFWLAVVAASAGIAYVVTYANPFTKVARAVSVEGMVAAEEERATVLKSVVVAAPVRAPVVSHTRFAEAGHATGGSTEESIEEAAHTERILLSPEALRLIAAEAGRSEETLDHYLHTFFTETKTHYEPEDGWILLSKERANAILLALRSPGMPAHTAPAEKAKEVQQATPVATSAPVREASAPVAMPSALSRNTTPASVPAFVSLLSSKKQEEAYAMLRDLNAKEGGASAFIGEVVRALDDVYKHRIEGNHSPNAEVASAVATLSNPELERVIGILVESVDYSYSSNRIGTKVAVAKVFEYFDTKK